MTRGWTEGGIVKDCATVRNQAGLIAVGLRVRNLESW